MKLLVEKPTLRQLENPVLLVKIGKEYVIKNGAGDLLTPVPGTQEQCIKWCHKNHCLPLRSMDEITKYGDKKKSIGMTLLIDTRTGEVRHACRNDHYEGHEGSFGKYISGEIICTEEIPVELANLVVNRYGMRAYQITLAGYDPEDSDSDDRIKWVLAPHNKAVERFLKHQAWKIQGFEQMIKQVKDFDDGVDLVLNSKGEVIAVNPDFSLDFLTTKEVS